MNTYVVPLARNGICSDPQGAKNRNYGDQVSRPLSPLLTLGSPLFRRESVGTCLMITLRALDRVPPRLVEALSAYQLGEIVRSNLAAKTREQWLRAAAPSEFPCHP